MKTAAAILATKDRDAASIFPGDAAAVSGAFRKMAASWHPDRNPDPDAAAVFARLAELRDAALGRRKRRASAQADDRPVLRGDDGRKFRFSALSRRRAPSGEVLVGRGHAVYLHDAGFDDLADAETSAVAGLSFADAAMKGEMSRFLPSEARRMTALDGRRAVSVRLPEGHVLLADLTAHLGGAVPAVHAAWIASGMLNVACYLQWAGLFHGAVGPETVFVNPENHSVCLLGGWGFSTPFGSRPRALPERTLAAVPRLAVKGETAREGLEGQCVRSTVQEILGHPGGGGLVMSKDVPAAMRHWLQSAPRGDAAADYADWHGCLVASWGPRKFEVMGVTSRDVYG